MRAGVIDVLIDGLAYTGSSPDYVKPALAGFYAICSQLSAMEMQLPRVVLLKAIAAIAPIFEQKNLARDTLFWCVAIVHQFTLRHDLHAALLAANVIPTLASTIVENIGRIAMLKLCFHGLVLLLSNEAPTSHTHLQVMVAAGLMPAALASLQSLDPELVYFALGILHGSYHSYPPPPLSRIPIPTDCPCSALLSK